MHSVDPVGVLISLLPQVPFALVAVAGLWYAVAARKRHPLGAICQIRPIGRIYGKRRAA